MNTTQKPSKDKDGPPEPKVRSLPKGAKNTMDIRDRDGTLRAALVGAGTNKPLPEVKEPSTMMWGVRTSSNNTPTENEAERLEHEKNNRKFLPYANVHTLISETLNRDKNEWLHNHERTRAAVTEAVEVLSEQKKRDLTNDYTRAKYGLVKGFGDITQTKEALYDFEMWLIKKESQYESLSGAYSELRMLSFAPYEQVVDRCREIIQTSDIVRDYYVLVGNTLGMNGASAEDTIEMEDGLTGKSYSTIGELEKLRFDVWLQTRVPIQEKDLIRENKSALERIGELLETLDNANAASAAAEARADRAYLMLELVDEDAYGLEAVAERIEARVTEMENKFTILTEKLEGGDSGEVLTEEDAAGEEIEQISAEELVGETTAALGEEIEGITSDDVREPSEEGTFDSGVIADLEALQAAETKAAEADAAALLEAAEAAVESKLPAREITEEVPLEEVEEIEEPEKRGRFWKTLSGRVIDNIVVYGFKGEGNKKLPPKFEDFVGQENQQQKYLRAEGVYNSWYGQAGRSIRKTLDGTRNNWKAVTAVATGVAVLAAATTGYFMYAPAQERPEQRALSELAKPTVTQVAVVDEVAPELDGDGEKVEPKPEPLEKPALADVLAKNGLELEKGTNMAKFYRGLNVEDVQERYVILEEALRTDEQLQKYERKYSEKPILEMYADFLTTAMAYVQLEGQTDVEKANAKATGERVAKRLEKLTQQKRIKKKLGNERASEMKKLAEEFNESVEDLPLVQEVQTEEEKIIELPVVTLEELEEMKKAGEEPEIPVIILPDTTDEKPFNMKDATGGVVGAEFKSLDSVSKVNEFNRKVNKAKDLKTKFLLSAHLSDQLIEHGMGAKMSEKRVLLMHVDAMNAAILFARAEGQGMTAIAEALNVFDSANAIVKQYMGYKKIKEAMKKRAGLEKNLTWLRKRAEELKNKVDAYERNKDEAIPFPGSPTVENENGAPTTMPEKVRINRDNIYVAMQTKVFSDHGLSILEHPLKVQEKMRGMKINSFDKFIIMEKLADEVMKNPKRMDGITKAERFEMLGILADFLDSSRGAANEPKHWPADYTLGDFLLDSLAIDVSDLIHTLRKKRTNDSEPPQGKGHLYFPLDEGTFKKIGVAAKTFDEQINYQYKQKKRMKNGSNGE